MLLLRDVSKAACAPAQLTIFYGGVVNVYDDISTEKAQAIVFLARNGAFPNTLQPWVQEQVSIPKTHVGDAVYVQLHHLLFLLIPCYLWRKLSVHQDQLASFGALSNLCINQLVKKGRMCSWI